MLEDLTASHETVGQWPVPPPTERWHAVLLAHAGFHAFWWDHERLGVSVGTFADESGHGDAHVWNALVPRDPTSNDVRLIDWDAWRIDTATDDLAYMIAVHWFPDWRRRYEQESLRRYHDALVAGGVRRYFFDALCEDDRHSVLWQIATPMWQANHGLGPWIWWHHLDRIMSAVHDLGCLELLD
jgi:Ecdysteroid kinase-like family